MKKIAASLAVAVLFVAAGSTASAGVRALTYGQARSQANRAARKLPVRGGVERVQVKGCDVFSPWQWACGVEADGSIRTSSYDPCKTIGHSGGCVAGRNYTSQLTSCMATIDVTKDRYGHVHHRREHDLSCDDGM